MPKETKDLRKTITSLRDEMDKALRDLRQREFNLTASLESLRQSISLAEADLAQYDRVKEQILAVLDEDDAS
jgi:hypothetical protein